MAKFYKDKIFIYIITRNIPRIKEYFESGYPIDRTFNKKDLDLLLDEYLIEDKHKTKVFHGHNIFFYEKLEETNASLLYLSCLLNFHAITKLLLKYGANPNEFALTYKYSHVKESLVKICLDLNHIKCAFELLIYGADISILNTNSFGYGKRIEQLKGMKKQILVKKYNTLIKQ